MGNIGHPWLEIMHGAADLPNIHSPGCGEYYRGKHLSGGGKTFAPGAAQPFNQRPQFGKFG